MKITFISVVLAIIGLLTFSTQSVSAQSALHFTNDYVEVLDTALLSGGAGKSITVEAWVKLDSIPVNVPVVMKFKDGQNKDWGLRIKTSGALNFASEDNNNPFQYEVLATSLLDTNWHHVAFTVDGVKDTVRLYLDGNELGTGKSFAGEQMADTAEPVLFGKHNYISPERYLYGTLDEVRIWSVARTQTEINTYKDSLLVGNESGLIGYWQFDEGSGQTAGDLSGNGHIANLMPVGAGPTWVAPGAPVSGNVDTTLP